MEIFIDTSFAEQKSLESQSLIHGSSDADKMIYHSFHLHILVLLWQ